MITFNLVNILQIYGLFTNKDENVHRYTVSCERKKMIREGLEERKIVRETERNVVDIAVFG